MNLFRNRNPFMDRLYRKRWVILIVVLFVLSYASGYYGLYLYDHEYHKPGQRWNHWDYLFYAFRLFYSSNVQFEYGINWPLQIGRLLAPVMAGFLLVIAYLQPLKKFCYRLMQPWIRGHVVICGLGSQGVTLARAWLERGATVVAIERNPDSLNIKLARHIGAIVIEGEARDPQVLKQAGVTRASKLFSVCGDDNAEAEVYIQVTRLAREEFFSGRLTCYLHIRDPRFYALLRHFSVEQRKLAPSARLEFFNLFENGVELLLREFSPFAPSGADPPRVLVIGLGPLGRNLVINMARTWYSLNPEHSRLMDLRVIDPEADRIVGEMLTDTPGLARSCRITPIRMTVDSAEFRQCGFLNPDGTGGAPEAVYVCADDDQDNLKAALALQGTSKTTRIVVCPYENSGLFNMLLAQPSRLGIQVFPLIDRTCTIDVVEMGFYEKYARALHEDYCRQRRAQGQTPEQNKSLVPWAELPESLKESNRAQAMGVLDELALVDCTMAPLTDWGRAPFQFTPEEIKRLATEEHDRWMRDLMRQGWRLGKMKDAERKLSPYLVPFEELPDKIAEYDRDIIRAIPVLAAKAGFEVRRLGAGVAVGD